MGFVVPISKTVGNMVDSAIEEDRLRDMEDASKTFADNYPSIEKSPPGATRPTKIPSDSESHNQPRRSLRLRRSSSHRNRHETRYRNDVIRFPTPIVTRFQRLGAITVVIRSIHAAIGVSIRRNSWQQSLSQSAHTIGQPCTTVTIACPTGPNITMTMWKAELQRWCNVLTYS